MIRSTPFILLMFVAPSVANAQAYCALRDPVGTISAMMPAATSHRSHVRVIRREHQEELRKVLPFTVMNGELGQHTLYEISVDGERAGFIHTRTEKGRFGLLEITWALSSDLRIVGFQMQRCRDPARRQVEEAALMKLLEGRTASELSDFLDESGKLRRELIELPNVDTYNYAESVVRSAVKTILVTRIAWADLFQ